MLLYCFMLILDMITTIALLLYYFMLILHNIRMCIYIYTHNTYRWTCLKVKIDTWLSVVIVDDLFRQGFEESKRRTYIYIYIHKIYT